jgi:hypothetical protein
MALRIYQNIAWFDIPMTNSDSINIGKTPEHLIRVQLNQLWRNLLFLLIVLLDERVECLGDVVHDQVEIDLLLVFALGEILVAQFHAVRMVDVLDYLVLPVLVTFVLEHLLDRHRLLRLTVDRLGIY